MKTQRTCLALDLKNDDELIVQYEYFHQPEHIWPEIPKGIRAGGIVDMQIYRLGTRLFMIVETEEGTDLNTAFEAIGKMPLQAEWAAFMEGFQQRLSEAKPHEHWAEMKPVFMLTDCLK
jgi:L-rhamnose mutarotase